jgi:hypothetical protein
MKTRMIVLASLVILGCAVPALAGGTTVLKKADGSSVRVICNPTACQSTLYDKAGRKVKMESSDGGNYGFAVTVQKYRGLGYN